VRRGEALPDRELPFRRPAPPPVRAARAPPCARHARVMRGQAELTLLYWRVGRRLASEILGGERAAYGERVVAQLAERLVVDYGRGWGERQLRDRLRFAETFPEEAIVHTLCTELSWSHLRLLAAVDDPLKREFYTGPSPPRDRALPAGARLGLHLRRAPEARPDR
jgi:uncharacterized protein DUF1016